VIAAMDQLLVVGRKSIAKELLSSLQQLGVVQLVPAHSEQLGEQLGQFQLGDLDRQAREAWEAAVARSEGLVTSLELEGALPPRAAGPQAAGKERVPSTLGEIQDYLAEVGAQADRLIAERGEIADELDVIETYLPQFRELAPLLAPLEGSRYLSSAAFLVPSGDTLERVQAALSEALPERHELVLKPQGKAYVAVAAVLKADQPELLSTLSRLGLGELRLPERYAQDGVAKAVHLMAERSQSLPKRRQAVQNELAQLGQANAGKLLAVRDTARNYRARYEAMDDLAGGHYSFAMQGWVPSSERARVVAALEKQFGPNVILESRRADEHHDAVIPVKLENPGWVKPFEGLLSLFAPPKYGYFDPSWTLAVFFPLFFGIVVGDMGFGLIFLALGLWLRARGKRGKPLGLGPLGITLQPAAMPSIGTVIVWCSAWAILWGFLYGEFFGNFLEHWPHDKPIFYTPLHHEAGYGWIPIILFRVEQYTPLLLLSLGFGIFQVLFGWAIRAFYGLRHGDMKHFWEGVGMFGGLTAIIVFATAFLTESLAGNGFVGFVVILGFALFIVGLIFAKLPLMLVELISNSGNILSYLRLFAVGLSAALVANLATNLGFAIAGVAPVVGPALGILVALAVHTLAIALTIIGHTLQPLRLQYVEFFTKFGFYEENGTAYRPFRFLGGKV
jgi:V/A-type H+-transporting ATPase subunit I